MKTDMANALSVDASWITIALAPIPARQRAAVRALQGRTVLSWLVTIRAPMAAAASSVAAMSANVAAVIAAPPAALSAAMSTTFRAMASAASLPSSSGFAVNSVSETFNSAKPTSAATPAAAGGGGGGSSASSPIAGIAGGAAGGLLVIAGAAAVFIVLRRRRLQSEQSDDATLAPDDFVVDAADAKSAPPAAVSAPPVSTDPEEEEAVSAPAPAPQAAPALAPQAEPEPDPAQAPAPAPAPAPPPGIAAAATQLAVQVFSAVRPWSWAPAAPPGQPSAPKAALGADGSASAFAAGGSRVRALASWWTDMAEMPGLASALAKAGLGADRAHAVLVEIAAVREPAAMVALLVAHAAGEGGDGGLALSTAEVGAVLFALGVTDAALVADACRAAGVQPELTRAVTQALVDAALRAVADAP